jgi:hypothetical protein
MAIHVVSHIEDEVLPKPRHYKSTSNGNAGSGEMEKQKSRCQYIKSDDRDN